MNIHNLERQEKMLKRAAAVAICTAIALGAYMASPLNTTTDIPTLKLGVNDIIKHKLIELSPIKVEKNTAYFTINCRSFDTGTYSYFVTSKGSSRHDELTMLNCPREMHYLDCPDFIVSYKENLAYVDVIKGYREQYSTHTVKNCAISAILYAPTEMGPLDTKTQKESYNKASWDDV